MLPRSVPYEHSPPRRDNILTVAMPGVTSSRAQLSRYVGVEDVVVVLQNESDGLAPLATSDGEACGLDAAPVLYRARCTISCRLLHNILPSPEVAEMVHQRWYATLNPVHWLLTLKEIATCLWFRVRPVQLCYSRVSRTNLAGLTDQRLFQREVQRAVEVRATMEAQCLTNEGRPHQPQKPEDTSQAGGGVDAMVDSPLDSAATSASREVLTSDGGGSSNTYVASPRSRGSLLRPHIVLFGCSRGATACFYSAMKLPAHLARAVSLVILEAPFDTLQHVTDASSFLPSLSRWFFRTFCDYADAATEQAAYSYDPAKVELRCPIAFVMSVRDARVPNACTQVLIDSVRAHLVPHRIPAVEVLTLRHSRHPCMAVGNREDQEAYVNFVERLYDRYCSGEAPAMA